jgi:glycosyltransferase involved in cell wall biosynthesis
MKPYCSNIFLLPNPIDLSKYEFRLRRAAQPRLIWLRAFHEIYNPSLAIYTVGSLFSNFSNLRLFMGGRDGGDGSFQNIQHLIERLGLSTAINLEGTISKEDVPTWLQKGDIFLNTTNIDNTPVSVLEAMACGLCIVTTRVGGIPYLLDHERDALLVPPNDPAAMAEAIQRILGEPGLSERLSKQARTKVEDFDWSAILPQWETLIRTV